MLSVPAVFGLVYMPAKHVVRADPTVTAQNLEAHATLFRAGVLGDLIGQGEFIFVALALYGPFKRVDIQPAGLMVTLIVVSIPITFVAESLHLGALTALDAGGPAGAFSETQRLALMRVSFNNFEDTILVAEIFWGLWLFPLGLLMWRSGFLPRFLGLLVLVSGCAYLIESVTKRLLRDYRYAVHQATSLLQSLELLTPLWLLITGAKDQPLEKLKP